MYQVGYTYWLVALGVKVWIKKENGDNNYPLSGFFSEWPPTFGVIFQNYSNPTQDDPTKNIAPSRFKMKSNFFASSKLLETKNISWTKPFLYPTPPPLRGIFGITLSCQIKGLHNGCHLFSIASVEVGWSIVFINVCSFPSTFKCSV